MTEVGQGRDFYLSLSQEEKNDLAEAIASDIFFLDEKLQVKAGELIKSVSEELWDKIADRNNFTL